MTVYLLVTMHLDATVHMGFTKQLGATVSVCVSDDPDGTVHIR